MNAVGPNGPIERFKSWQTWGSTVGAALALATGRATASTAVTAARAARGFRGDNIE
jgi:hypothetical protein